MAAARRSAFPLAIAFTLALAPVLLRAQDVKCDRGDVEVRSLSFEGNSTFSDAQLAQLINTTATGWARARLGPVLGGLFGRKRCLDRQDFPLDRVRLIVFYRNKGFDRVAVDTTVASVEKDAVAVTFTIREGPPIRIDSVVVKGLDSVSTRRQLLRNLPLGRGSLFDKYAIDSVQAMLARSLRNAGYPRAQVLRAFSSSAERRTATVEFTAVPGPRARVGEIVVAPVDTGRPRVSARTIRDIFGVDSGDVYSEAALVTGQRRLYETETFRAVRVELDSASLRAPGDSLQRVIVRIAEGEMHAATLGAGWGTLDCFRVQGGYSNYNFLGGARRLDLSARVSKLGVGEPFVIAKGPVKSQNVCTPASGFPRDQYGDIANYYVGATLRQPVLFGVRSLPAITLYREIRSEYNAFRRTTPIGGVATLTSTRRPRMPVTLSYRVEAGRTSSSQAFFCAVQLICDPAERARVQRLQRLAVGSIGLVRNATDHAINPTSGTLLRLDFRHASPAVGSENELQFNTVVNDLAWYRRVGAGVFAARLRGGSVLGTRLNTAFSDRGSFIPAQERLYAGGPNSVRGFRQNELGPKAYLATRVRDSVAATDTFVVIDNNAGVRVAPVGGNTLLVGNLEYRARSPFFPNVLQYALFTDVGEVWNRGADEPIFGFIRTHWTPGVGLRALTAFGAIRFDIAYNGYERRSGPAYFDQGVRINDAGETEGGQLFCVSPGNGLRVTGTGINRRQVSGTCPGSYHPDASSNFFRRLVPSISIGQAF